MIVFVAGTVASCNFRWPKRIETKEQTLNAILGKWRHTDTSKSDVKNILFTTTKNNAGDSTCILTFRKKDSNGDTSQINTWRYNGIGKVEIFDPDFKEWLLDFSFINNTTLKLQDNDIYIKDK